MNNLETFNDLIDDEYEIDDDDFCEDYIDEEEIDAVVYRPRRSGYYCNNCERGFTYPLVMHTTQSRLFGVETHPNDEWFDVEVCPYCKSDDITEFKNER